MVTNASLLGIYQILLDCNSEEIVTNVRFMGICQILLNSDKEEA